MEQPEKFDVVIAGGGPAGSTAALGLTALGFKIALVESLPFPRNQIGESLSPGVLNILKYLDAGHLLEESLHLSGLKSTVIWEAKQASDNQQLPTRIMVDRAKMDFSLLSLAAKRGLRIFQPAGFESCKKVGAGWEMRIRQQGIAKLLLANCVLDARGRRGVTTKNRLLTAPASYAIWAHTPLARMPYQTVVEAMEQGWLWGSPTVDDRFRIMAFIDPLQLKKNRPDTILKQLAERSCLFKGAAKNDGLSIIKTCPVVSYCHIDPWQNGYIRIGEAAFSIDPLSSTGVEKAMRISLQAVIAVNTLLTSGKEQIAASFYENRLVESIATHMIWTSDYYKAAWPGNSHSFWNDRSRIMMGSPGSISPFYDRLLTLTNNMIKNQQEKINAVVNRRGDLSELWVKKINLSSEIIYQETICVVGNVLLQKTAVKLPSMLREIVFIEDYEIISLLAIIEKQDRFADIIYRWGKLMPYEQALKIGTHLIDIELLCVQD